ncbi:cupin domain-containing protein [Dongia rigui]|uniref:Cupin domain-containing protein n=1 Tax=Dongia rigui TaxID=940149 RepID=A0ABU5DWE0_9PROT|nr:cupin domain-containing protein [Dongia rigui]MDY0871631.1 cupin domain-containing protein [Dongia rigui]
MEKMMMSGKFAAGLLLCLWSGAAWAEDAKPVTVTPILATESTASGQPITFPSGHLAFTASAYDIAPGASLPEHKHPFPRYAYVVAGTIAVTNTVTGKTTTYKAGDVIIEAVDQWHKAANTGSDAIKLIVYDFAPKGAQNVVRK